MNLTPEEQRAMKLLRQLESIWPPTLMAITVCDSPDRLHVVRTAPNEAVEDVLRCERVGVVRMRIGISI